MMTLEQIDRALADWQAKLALASDNLLELDDQITYKRLKGDVVSDIPPAALTGITRTRVVPALAAISDLWQYLQGLNELIKRAQELRRSMPRVWTNQNTLAELERMLTGPSIRLPAVETPLAQRSLLSSSEKAESVSPEQLLGAMTRIYEEARDTVLKVDAAWQRLEPDMASALQEITLLQSLADSLGDGALPELSVARAQIDHLRGEVQSDPLGVNVDFGTLTATLQPLRAQLEQRERQRSHLATDLQSAHTGLTELAETHQQCEAALEECRLKIQNPQGLLAPLAANTLSDLTDWLATLEATLQSGRWQSAAVGLARWQATLTAYLTAERNALKANRAPLETRSELRGRLSSLRAKSQAYLARGVVLDPELSRIAAEAEQTLSRHPTPLDLAERQVSDFETRLARSLSKS